ncbi:hypothetical protein ACFLTE_05030 [Bacteroidota bacterium]
MKKIIYLLLTIITFQINAQDFEVSPIDINFNAEPGDMQSKIITIKNHSNKKTGYLLAVQDYLVNKSGKTGFLDANATRNSIANWISISPSYVEIAPNGEQTVQVSLQAPLDDYTAKWGAISVSPAIERTAFSADGRLSAGVGVSGSIIIKLYQSPTSNQNHRAKISNLKEITIEGDTVRTFTANIDNIGDKITECKVFLIAANLETAEERQFDPIKIKTYPKTARLIELKMPKVLPDGKYALSAILDYGSNSELEGTQMIITVP